MAEVFPKMGFKADAYGLIGPTREGYFTALKKIAPNLLEVAAEIIVARNRGKTILYLPGSYDLVHAGHASFIHQALAYYMKESGCKREDLFVLVLADDDELVWITKSHKHVSQGGNEVFKRPLQSRENFPELAVSTRLLDLAAISEVDLVGLIDCPLHADYLITSKILSASWLKDGLVQPVMQLWLEGKASIRDIQELHIAAYNHHNFWRCLPHRFKKVKSDFKKGNWPMDRSKNWSLQSWQFFIHCFLARDKGQIVRIISRNDKRYLYQVEFLMKEAGIEVIFIEDRSIVTTTELIERYGVKVLLRAKQSSCASLIV